MELFIDNKTIWMVVMCIWREISVSLKLQWEKQLCTTCSYRRILSRALWFSSEDYQYSPLLFQHQCPNWTAIYSVCRSPLRSWDSNLLISRLTARVSPGWRLDLASVDLHKSEIRSLDDFPPRHIHQFEGYCTCDRLGNRGSCLLISMKSRCRCSNTTDSPVSYRVHLYVRQ